MITHYDLFAGIGGFSLALEEVFTNEPIRHIFCEWEKFPTAVLKNHWPDGEFWGDIAELVTHTNSQRERDGSSQVQETDGEVPERHDHAEPSDSDRSDNVADTKHKGLERGSNQRPGHPGLSSGKGSNQTQDWAILTGGFPCQPFSAAGRRRGTADDRYQWPNMFEVIRNTKPDWVIAENVRGLVTWNEGMVLEQVCADLESEGYEVQPFIIPAVAVNAPHRRDRVWIIAYNGRQSTDTNDRKGRSVPVAKPVQEEKLERRADDRTSRNATNTTGDRQQRRGQAAQTQKRYAKGHVEAGQLEGRPKRSYPDWRRNWQEVAFSTCDDSMDDGLSRIVDGVPYSRAKWRKDSLKAYGNGIVPPVAVQIMQSIKDTQHNNLLTL